MNLQTYKDFTANDYKQIADQLADLRKQYVEAEKDVKRLTEELADTRRYYEAEIQRMVKEHENALSCEIAKHKAEFYKYRQLVTLEVHVLHTTLKRQQEDVQQSRLNCKQIATLLKCPRAHFSYINEHGVHEFIENCEKIITEHDSKHSRAVAAEQRIR